MFGLGPIKWLGGYMMASIAAGFMDTRIMEAVWSGAPEIVQAAIFRRRVGAGNDVGNDE